MPEGHRELWVNQAAWNTQARLALPHDIAQPRAVSLQWAQLTGCGPGIDILGDLNGKRVIELGCGNGDNAVAIASGGAHVTGVDIAPTQLQRARRRWADLPIDWQLSDACTYLATPGPYFEVMVSIFGAIGLCAPRPLLDLAASRLTADGVLAFSIPDVKWLADRGDHLRHADGSVSPVARWKLTPAQWEYHLHAAGFDVRDRHDITHPRSQRTCCTILLARRT